MRPRWSAAGPWSACASSSTYGVPQRERRRVVNAVIDTHDWAYTIVRDALARGHRSFHHHWREGGRLRADRTREWIDARHEAMREALEDDRDR
jgi:hypothetical protein